jgi:hypothetical protein
MTRRMFDFDFPYGPEKVVDLFKTYFGPTKTAFERLDSAKQQAYHDELLQLWEENNEANDGRTVIRGEYLEVHARPN